MLLSRTENKYRKGNLPMVSAAFFSTFETYRFLDCLILQLFRTWSKGGGGLVVYATVFYIHFFLCVYLLSSKILSIPQASAPKFLTTISISFLEFSPPFFLSPPSKTKIFFRHFLISWDKEMPKCTSASLPLSFRFFFITLGAQIP